ncbi:thiamine pyrophosphokinase [Neonectria punicea]|uniref:Thiamine pyrophosphokinase n=1 Tax=Neonectria punicea TaxID=979145 RepID=A0ABR1GJK9_9HYPO
MAAQQQPFEWRPAKLLQDYNVPQEFALLVLNQPLRSGGNLRKLWKNSSVRVAADGGANRLHELSSFHGKFSNLQLIIGDLDSLSPLVRSFYSSQPHPATIIHDPDQESTDFGKAINWLRAKYPAGIDIVALGGIGGRVDQGLSQLHHLYRFQTDPAYAAGRIYLLSGSSLTFLLKAGVHHVQVREDGERDVFGKHVGIIPLKEPSVISTRGLEWDVTDWATEIGGQLSTSNHVLPDTQVVQIETDKDVLFTIALRQADGEEND